MNVAKRAAVGRDGVGAVVAARARARRAVAKRARRKFVRVALHAPQFVDVFRVQVREPLDAYDDVAARLKPLPAPKAQ